ncbi:MAG: LL-diaminopimelate aminotransferase [Clostridiales bacterium]|jgi:LL-diaminopimelate aminotransferase|nr:LL-diaminopimelate aminotransferase [Clostridiales bacterium]
MKINENFNNLKQNYLFAEIANRVRAYAEKNPERELIRLGIGDVTLPLAPAVTDALRAAAEEMGRKETFRGYADYEGYEFLRAAIAANDYKARGIDVGETEIYVSDGAKSDTANFTDLLSADNLAAICDPVYPVYNDANLLDGRPIRLMPCVAEKGFLPEIPDWRADVVYLCFPNNPTGVAATADYLRGWVDYAVRNGSLILYDSAYEAFVREPGCVRSIYEVEGAKECAVEFRSFSKTAGFTGLRCAYTVIPKDLSFDGQNIGRLWLRRQATKFNGVAYIVQKAAEAVYSEAGRAQIKENIDYYAGNADELKAALSGLGLPVWGGVNAPYIWFKSPLPSWDTFDKLLNEAGLVVTPGAGFGSCGEGYARLTAFGDKEMTAKAASRLSAVKL